MSRHLSRGRRKCLEKESDGRDIYPISTGSESTANIFNWSKVEVQGMDRQAMMRLRLNTNMTNTKGNNEIGN